MRYLFKPSDKSRVRLFANNFESTVFWIAVAALIFLLIITFYRGCYMQNITEQYNAVASEVNPALIHLQKTISINDSLEEENRKLQSQMSKIQSEMKELKNQVNNMKISQIIPQKNPEKKRTIYLPAE